MTAHISPSHIVGIGASAGGLAALEEFFKAMPEDSGMAFVLIQHLSPDFKSLMDDLLARHTKMPIYHVENGLELEANAIYLIPPRKVITVADGHLYLEERVGQHLILPIDIFFESLASAAKNMAIGIVLSGTGSDGSRGIVTIHEAGGLVIAQSRETAQFDGMPRAALNTGICDYVTTPTDMPSLLLEYARNPEGMRLAEAQLNIVWDEGEFAEIFAYLRRDYGLDFSKYKPTTVGRRIARRLSFHHLQKISEYVQLLETDSDELDALYHDLLIGVTEFFRDPEVFTYLGREVIPELFRNASPDGLRVWVAACATGEEAYSLAILLHEYAEKIQYNEKISIFATDVHRKSLEVASQGVYEEDRLQNVTADTLTRYFTPEGPGKFKIIPEVRKMVIFAPQNLISDPPFTKLDLVCCRNLLIYFSSETQEKAIAALNFALRTGGVLFLGSSEGVGKFADAFSAIQATYKIYRKQRDVRLNFNLTETAAKPGQLFPGQAWRSKNSVMLDRQLLHDYDHIFKQFVPAGVLLNEQRQVLHYFGEIHQYLKPPEGLAETDITQMVTGELHLAVSVALQRAATLKTQFTLPNVATRSEPDSPRVDVSADFIPDEKTNINHYLLTFTPVKTLSEVPAHAEAKRYLETMENSQTLENHIADLEMDLQLARENLQATVEELQTSNEELQATNEELLASNEELQSTNEELHSLNEELYTVNAEYEKKNSELQTLNDDHVHLLESLDVGVVFLDDGLVIRKFNPASALAFKLLSQDIGRPIDHIAFQLTDQNTMQESLREVLQTGQSIESEVQAKDGTWLLQRVLPYLNKGEVTGVILTFTDVTHIKTEQARLQTLFELLPSGVAILDKNRRVVLANPQLEQITALNEDALVRGVYTERHYIRADGTDMPQDEFASALVFNEHKPIYDVETGIVKEDGSQTWTNVSAAPLPDGGVVVVTADITARKQAEAELNRWGEIFRNVGWGVVVGAVGSKTLDLMNPAYAAMHGYTVEELMSQPIELVNSPQFRVELPMHMQLAHEKGHHVFESTHLKKDGTIFPVMADVVEVKDQDGNGLYWIVSLQDITERKKGEQALRRWKDTFDNVAWGIVIGDPESKNLGLMNTAFAAMHGYTPEELEGTEIINVFAPECRADLPGIIQQAHETGRALVETKHLRKDGTAFPVLLDVATVRDEQGDLLYRIVGAQDITERKLAEAELRASEEKYRSLLESLDSVIAIVDERGRFIYMNDESARQLGGTPADFTGKLIHDLFPQEYADHQMASILQVLREDQAHIFESETFVDGKMRWYHTSIQPIHDDEGKAVHALVNTTNIDHIKAAQKELRELNQSLEKRVKEATEEIQDLYNHAPAGYHSLDGEGRIKFVNATELGWLARTREEVIGHLFTEFILPEQVEQFQEKHLQQILSGKSVYDLEYHLVRADGTFIPVLNHCEPVLDAQGKFIHSRGTLMNLTERKIAENALRENLRRVNALYAITQGAITAGDLPELLTMVADTLVQAIKVDRVTILLMDIPNQSVEHVCKSGPGAGQIQDISFAEAWEGLTGWAIRNRSMAISPADTPDERESATVKKRREATQAGEIVVVPLIYKNHVLGTLTAIQKLGDSAFIKGDTDLIQAIANQASLAIERLRAEENLREANLALARISQTKDDFLANMSHELRTPLNGILGMTEILLEEYRGPLNDRQRTFVNTIEASGRHLLSLINDILDLSKIEADKMELHLEPVVLSEICQASLAFVKQPAVKKGVRIEFVAGEKEVQLQADGRRLKQILVNLLNNAVKFTPEKGKVTLKIHPNRKNSTVEISVTDTGIGISEEDQHHLFSPFTQVDNSITRNYEGTGLGLTLVKRLVELHGGSVSLDSAPGKGSQFTITLPWHDPAPSPETSDSTLDEAILESWHAKSTATILLVEDNETNILAIGDYLDARGYSMIYAHDGLEAIAKAVESAPEIILMDIQMPKMDGLETTRRLRADPQFATTPIIALTARAMAGDYEQCIAAGATDYLSKPVRMGELVAMIERLLVQ